MMTDHKFILMFQPVFKYYQSFNGNIGKILGWKPPATSNNSFAPKLILIRNSKIAAKFDRKCLKQGKLSFSQRNIIHLFNDYELDT